jgi:hypothetical protein
MRGFGERFMWIYLCHFGKMWLLEVGACEQIRSNEPQTRELNIKTLGSSEVQQAEQFMKN